MEESVDLGALQQQLQLQRSSLAGQILSRLPASSPSTSKTSDATAVSTTRRSATLGVGAEAPVQPTFSATDQKLRAKLGATSGSKRRRDTEVGQTPKRTDGSPNDDNETEESDVRQTKSRRRANRGPDVFAVAEAKIKAAQAKAAPVPVSSGDQPDFSTMSKSQRKKWNKRQREQAAAPATPKEDATADEPAPSSTPLHGPVAKPSVTAPGPSPVAPSEKNETPLTSLQSSMLASLQGARFRSINERLYTHDSHDALAFMQKEPQMFDEYHAGFRQQVRKWPKNPVDKICELVLPTTDKKKKYHVRASSLPGALLVDMGAGEAGLAKTLVPKGFHVLSYDLVDTPDGWVRGLDVAAIGSIPLPGYLAPLGLVWDASPPTSPAMVDIVVFCLSLMGTNWVDMITEAWRILKPHGELVIAEVTSRLGATGDTTDFTTLVEAMGFHLDWHDTTNNTHFALFKFSKVVQQKSTLSTQDALDTTLAPAALVSSVENADQAKLAREELVRRGASVLKPCLYKRR
ncbi:25S rRNA (adenine645-N1)-methyltransferase [Malassezia pachydermatis]